MIFLGCRETLDDSDLVLILRLVNGGDCLRDVDMGEVEDAVAAVEGEVEHLQLHLLLRDIRGGQGSLQILLGVTHDC
jgi:hypothetical protein